MEVLGIQFFLALFEKKLDAYPSTLRHKKPPNETGVVFWVHLPISLVYALSSIFASSGIGPANIQPVSFE